MESTRRYSAAVGFSSSVFLCLVPPLILTQTELRSCSTAVSNRRSSGGVKGIMTLGLCFDASLGTETE